MNAGTIVGFVNVFCVGILAGEESAICYGVRTPVASLDERPHIQLRQALIRRLRVLVPAVFALTILSGVAVTIVDGFDHGFGFRCAGLLALLTFIVITLKGPPRCVEWPYGKERRCATTKGVCIQKHIARV